MVQLKVYGFEDSTVQPRSKGHRFTSGWIDEISTTVIMGPLLLGRFGLGDLAQALNPFLGIVFRTQPKRESTKSGSPINANGSTPLPQT
jgi:hypothetical protein